MAITEQNAAFDFESANSIDEIVEAVKNMDTCLQQKDIDFIYWKMVKEFSSEGENPEKVLTFGKGALKVLLSNDQSNHHASYVFAAYVLIFMGFTCFKLKRSDESLGYVNGANTILCKLEQDCDCCLDILAATHLELHTVKTGMGMKEEAFFHLEKALSIKEKTVEEGCVEHGMVKKNVCKASIIARNYEAALPSGLEALEIFTEHFGDSSVQVAEMRRLLGVIYCNLGVPDKALELNQSSISALKDQGDTSDMMIQAEIERGHMLIENGKHEEAMKCLNAMVSNSEIKEVLRGRALIFMARASYYMENLEKAKKCMEIAQEIIGKKETDPNMAAFGFVYMSSLYDLMGDFETALSLLKRVLTMPEISQKYLVDCSSNLFALVSLAGKEKEEIRYLEGLVETLKESLGPEHSQVGYCYEKLGLCCWNANSLYRAKNYLTLAKHIMEVSLGPNHLDTLSNSQNLSILYSLIRRYDEAIAIQEEVVQGLRGGEPEYLDEAIGVLDYIKQKKNSWCSIL